MGGSQVGWVVGQAASARTRASACNACISVQRPSLSTHPCWPSARLYRVWRGRDYATRMSTHNEPSHTTTRVLFEYTSSSEHPPHAGLGAPDGCSRGRCPEKTPRGSEPWRAAQVCPVAHTCVALTCPLPLFSWENWNYETIARLNRKHGRRFG